MKTINIYITHHMAPNVEKEGEIRYDIVLDKAGKESNSVGSTCIRKGTMHGVILSTIVEAIERVNEPVYMNIFMNDQFLSNMFYGQMDTWASTNWERDIKHKEEWKKIEEASRKHRINLIYAIKHSMTNWQETQIKNDCNNISQNVMTGRTPTPAR